MYTEQYGIASHSSHLYATILGDSIYGHPEGSYTIIIVTVIIVIAAQVGHGERGWQAVGYSACMYACMHGWCMAGLHCNIIILCITA